MLGNSLALTLGNPVLRGGGAAFVQKNVLFAEGGSWVSGNGDQLIKDEGLTGQPATLEAFTLVGYLKRDASVTAPMHWFGINYEDTGSSVNSLNTNTLATTFKIRVKTSFAFFPNMDSTNGLSSSAMTMVMISGRRTPDEIVDGSVMMYFGDTSEASVTWPVGNVIPWNGVAGVTKAVVGGSVGVRPWTGTVGLVWFKNTFTDFSVQANRRLFWSGTEPVAPPSGAMVHYGSTQLAAAWNAGTNQGTGGTFTMNAGYAVTDE